MSAPPEENELKAGPEPASAPERKVYVRLSSMGIVILFILIGLSLLLFSGQIVTGLVEASANAVSTPVVQATALQPTPLSTSTRRGATSTPTSSITPTPTSTAGLPFFVPASNDTALSVLPLPGGHYILYQGITHLFLVSTTDNSVQPLYTPGYNYNQAVRPLLTSDGQLVYSGAQGIWLTDVFDPQPIQLVHLAANITVTSLVQSQDGQTIAWSTEPLDGNGQINIYTAALSGTQLTGTRSVYQQSALNCPCFRIFSFLNGSGTNANTTLLLTDDRGSSEAVQYGLWSLDMTANASSATPQQVIDEKPQQGPLTLAPYSSTLLYSTYEGAVPLPTDNSVPVDVAALSYANSLSITSLGGSPVQLGSTQIILAEQHNLTNSAQYHWVTTPTFSPDGGTLVYVEFSSDAQSPYDRHSAIYSVKVSGSGSHLQAGPPELVATATVNLLELGPWLNSHVVTMYGDGAIYALDVNSGALTVLTQPGGYLRILDVIGTGQT